MVSPYGDADPLGDMCSTTTGETVQMTGKNIGDLLNAASITWGLFEGGFDLTHTNPNGPPAASAAPPRRSPRERRPTTFRTTSRSSTTRRTAEPEAHASDLRREDRHSTATPATTSTTQDFFDALGAGNLPRQLPEGARLSRTGTPATPIRSTSRPSSYT